MLSFLNLQEAVFIKGANGLWITFGANHSVNVAIPKRIQAGK